MPKRARNYHSWLINRLSDPEEAERYLNVAALDSTEMFLKALRNVAEANKMAKVAEEAGVNRESLYKALSEEGNPRLSTLECVLDVLGMNLAVSLKSSTVSPPSSIALGPNAEIVCDTGNTLETATITTGSNILMHRDSTTARSVPWELVAQQKTNDSLLIQNG